MFPKLSLTHLQRLEAENIRIFREVVAECEHVDATAWEAAERVIEALGTRGIIGAEGSHGR